MIYISSSCIKSDKIKDSILKIAGEGYNNIELSGGTNYYYGYIDDLIDLKKKFNLNYIIHNYFPPPEDHFVINLASSCKDIYIESINHVIRAIELAKKLEINKIGVHAGFLVDPNVEELGRPISPKHFINKKDSIKRFCEAVKILQQKSGNIKIYFENNVLSKINHNTFKRNIFLFTNYIDLLELYKFVDFPIILDIAHLKVSCKSLKIDFEDQFRKLFNLSNYIHLSDNDGLTDSNHKINKNSDLFNFLKQFDFSNKIVTLEVYNGLNDLNSSFRLLEKLIKSF